MEDTSTTGYCSMDTLNCIILILVLDGPQLHGVQKMKCLFNFFYWIVSRWCSKLEKNNFFRYRMLPRQAILAWIHWTASHGLYCWAARSYMAFNDDGLLLHVVQKRIIIIFLLLNYTSKWCSKNNCNILKKTLFLGWECLHNWLL